jgi:RHS repeat-associated protein
MKAPSLVPCAAAIFVAACGAPSDAPSLAQVLEAQSAAGVFTYAYDAQGLVTSIGGAAIAAPWVDALGRAVAVGDLAIAYGPDGHVDHATRGGRTATYVTDEDGERLAKRLDGAFVAAWIDGDAITPAELVEPVRAAGRVLGVARNGRFAMAAGDSRGTIVAGTDGATALPSPYGARAAHPDVATAIDYAGAPFDADVGVHRMGVRDYDARTGRFLEPDPLLLEDPRECVARPVECSLYGYAAARPSQLVDPTGTEAEEATPPPSEPGETLDSILAASPSSREPTPTNAELLSLGPVNAHGFEQLTRNDGLVSYVGGDRQYATPKTIEALRNIGDDWHASHPNDPRIRVGDISLAQGGPMAINATKAHHLHQTGTDIDIRPIRNDGREEHVKWTDREYSRDLTRELVRTIVARSGPDIQRIYFNDPVLQAEFPGVVKEQSGHDDHLHIRFKVP